MASAVISATAMGADAQSSKLLERGTYLMNSIVACGNCHTTQGPQLGPELAGGTIFKEGFGEAIAPNITPDKETGIGNWTDVQIIAAIREGKRPDGSIIGPPMPIALYRGISDNDAKAIVAYLRKTKPVSNKVAKSAYKVPLPTAYGPSIAHVPDVSRTNKLAYGAYLAGPLGHCMECHSSPNDRGIPDFVNKPGAGGMAFNGPWGTSVAANITPTAIAAWTDVQLQKAITSGERPNGDKLRPPMGFAYYKNMSKKDLDALVAYLRTLKPL